MTFNSGNFWNLEKDYYSETTNAGAGKYNTYQDFISGSKVNSNLLNFEFEDPFDFIPSYGSSVDFVFEGMNSDYGNGYLYVHPSAMNNIIASFNLNFQYRSDSEAQRIIQYLRDRDGYKQFPFQTKERSGLSSANAYQSLYSISPYFIQDFSCFSFSNENEYEGSTSIAAQFVNQDFSILNIKNILKVESMPQAKKDIIEEYRKKYVLDIMPSYSISRNIETRNLNFQEPRIRFQRGNDGINSQKDLTSLNFENIDDEKLLKILAFFLFKIGQESFSFTYKNPDPKTAEFICDRISHTYLYKGSHSVTVSIQESPIRRRLEKGNC